MSTKATTTSPFAGPSNDLSRWRINPIFVVMLIGSLLAASKAA